MHHLRTGIEFPLNVLPVLGKEMDDRDSDQIQFAVISKTVKNPVK